jgi:uncharacterized protein (TIGR03435 family)
MSILAAQPRFDAASVRESPVVVGTEGSRREHVRVTPTSVTLSNASLSFAMQWAYGFVFYQVSGPSWLADQRWDFQANTQDPRQPQELRQRMRTLLADRFKLAVRRETQPKPAYALVGGKQKLRKSNAEGDLSTMHVDGGDFVFTNITMAEFAKQLSDFATVDRPVVDKTGIEGRYDFKLESIRGGEGPSIFTAVSEIGLQLKKSVEPLEVVWSKASKRNPRRIERLTALVN